MFNNPYCDQILCLELQLHGHRPTAQSSSGGKTYQTNFHIFSTTLADCSYEELLDTFWTKAACKFWDQICTVATSCALSMQRRTIRITQSWLVPVPVFQLFQERGLLTLEQWIRGSLPAALACGSIQSSGALNAPPHLVWRVPVPPFHRASLQAGAGHEGPVPLGRVTPSILWKVGLKANPSPKY